MRLLLGQTGNVAVKQGAARRGDGITIIEKFATERTSREFDNKVKFGAEGE
jgi:hypothetical protein